MNEFFFFFNYVFICLIIPFKYCSRILENKAALCEKWLTGTDVRTKFTKKIFTACQLLLGYSKPKQTSFTFNQTLGMYLPSFPRRVEYDTRSIFKRCEAGFYFFFS